MVYNLREHKTKRNQNKIKTLKENKKHSANQKYTEKNSLGKESFSAESEDYEDYKDYDKEYDNYIKDYESYDESENSYSYYDDSLNESQSEKHANYLVNRKTKIKNSNRFKKLKKNIKNAKNQKNTKSRNINLKRDNISKNRDNPNKINSKKKYKKDHRGGKSHRRERYKKGINNKQKTANKQKNTKAKKESKKVKRRKKSLYIEEDPSSSSTTVYEEFINIIPSRKKNDKDKRKPLKPVTVLTRSKKEKSVKNNTKKNCVKTNLRLKQDLVSKENIDSDELSKEYFLQTNNNYDDVYNENKKNTVNKNIAKPKMLERLDTFVCDPTTQSDFSEKTKDPTEKQHHNFCEERKIAAKKYKQNMNLKENNDGNIENNTNSNQFDRKKQKFNNNSIIKEDSENNSNSENSAESKLKTSENALKIDGAFYPKEQKDMLTDFLLRDLSQKMLLYYNSLAVFSSSQLKEKLREKFSVSAESVRPVFVELQRKFFEKAVNEAVDGIKTDFEGFERKYFSPLAAFSGASAGASKTTSNECLDITEANLRVLDCNIEKYLALLSRQKTQLEKLRGAIQEAIPLLTPKTALDRRLSPPALITHKKPSTPNALSGDEGSSWNYSLQTSPTSNRFHATMLKKLEIPSAASFGTKIDQAGIPALEAGNLIPSARDGVARNLVRYLSTTDWEENMSDTVKNSFYSISIAERRIKEFCKSRLASMKTRKDKFSLRTSEAMKAELETEDRERLKNAVRGKNQTNIELANEKSGNNATDEADAVKAEERLMDPILNFKKKQPAKNGGETIQTVSDINQNKMHIVKQSTKSEKKWVFNKEVSGKLQKWKKNGENIAPSTKMTEDTALKSEKESG